MIVAARTVDVIFGKQQNKFTDCCPFLDRGSVVDLVLIVAPMVCGLFVFDPCIASKH